MFVLRFSGQNQIRLHCSPELMQFTKMEARPLAAALLCRKIKRAALCRKIKRVALDTNCGV
jgi:hypothetical protein